jgi:hypothetical protein
MDAQQVAAPKDKIRRRDYVRGNTQNRVRRLLL